MCQLCNSPCPIPVPKGFSPTLLVKKEHALIIQSVFTSDSTQKRSIRKTKEQEQEKYNNILIIF